jgi:hypothetical protein
MIAPGKLGDHNAEIARRSICADAPHLPAKAMSSGELQLTIK